MELTVELRMGIIQYVIVLNLGARKSTANVIRSERSVLGCVDVWGVPIV